MTDERMDQTFRELQAELTVTASPEFAAKVRARIAEQPVHSWLGLWRLAAASAVVLACAVVTVVMWRGGRIETASSAIEGPSPAPVASSAEPRREAEPAVGSVRRPVVRTAVRAEPEVLVSPDQAMAINRYMAGLRSGQLAGAAGAAPIEGTAGEIVTPKLIEIPLIVVDLLPGTPDGRGGGRRNP